MADVSTSAAAAPAASLPADTAAAAPAGVTAAPAENLLTDAPALTPEQIAQAENDKAAADAASAAKNEEDAKAAKDAEALKHAPEKYDLKAAEGSTLNPEVQALFETVAKELDLPNAAAQKLVETMGPKIAQAQAAQFAQIQADWTTQAKGDKEFGGDNLNANLAVAKKALDTFGTPELKTLLNETGLGNHPEIIRAFVRAGRAISPDKFVPAGGGSNTPRDPAKTLYPNQK